jgi:hypothetical protein
LSTQRIASIEKVKAAINAFKNKDFDKLEMSNLTSLYHNIMPKSTGKHTFNTVFSVLLGNEQLNKLEALIELNDKPNKPKLK